MANGAIARCRIINATRSDGASMMVPVKFGVDVPLSKVVLFKSAVQNFIRDRPQEFCDSVGFRLNRLEADLGFVEYVVVAQSHKSWADPSSVIESRGKVASFCLETQKKLDIRYTSPPQPKNVPVDNADDRSSGAHRRDRGAASDLMWRKQQGT